MKLYRVFPYDSRAAADQPGGALFIPPGSSGRFDNPDLYRGLYASPDLFGAIAERCGEFSVPWRDEHFLQRTPFHADPLRLAIAEYEADMSLVEFVRVPVLHELNVSSVVDVISRERTATQQLARRTYTEKSAAAKGLSWWSYYDPAFTNVMLWDPTIVRLEGTPTPLSITAPAVVDAARHLYRTIDT